MLCPVLILKLSFVVNSRPRIWASLSHDEVGMAFQKARVYFVFDKANWLKPLIVLRISLSHGEREVPDMAFQKG